MVNGFMKINEIAKIHDVKIVKITKNNIAKYSKLYEIPRPELRENSYVIDGEIIVLGIYKDPELRLTSFFHELGHTLITKHFAKLINHDMMLEEYQAWIEGLRIAKKYGYEFSDNGYLFILQALQTYYKSAIKVYKSKKHGKKVEDDN